MRNEEPPKPQKETPNYSLIEYVLNNEPSRDLTEEQLGPLIDDIDNPRSYALLVRYLKENIKVRLPELMTRLNFDFVASPKSFDTYIESREKIKELLKEEDGVIDEPKREQVRLLLKVIKDTNVHK